MNISSFLLLTVTNMVNQLQLPLHVISSSSNCSMELLLTLAKITLLAQFYAVFTVKPPFWGQTFPPLEWPHSTTLAICMARLSGVGPFLLLNWLPAMRTATSRLKHSNLGWWVDTSPPQVLRLRAASDYSPKDLV